MRWAAAALALLAGSCSPGVPVEASRGGHDGAPRPDVLIVAIDGLGIEQVAALRSAGAPTFEGAPLHRTPALDRLTTEGVTYGEAYATSPWGAETLASALTGLSAGAVRGSDASTLPPSLAEQLAHLGYRTALVVSHARHLDEATDRRRQTTRGFERVIEVPGADSPAGARADDVTSLCREWLLEEPGPSLLVVTLADPRPPHHLYDGLIPAADVPYEGQVLSGLDHAELLRRAPAFTDVDRARLEELHASEVAMADRAFGRIAGAAIDRRRTPPVLVVFGLRAPALGQPGYISDGADEGAASLRRYGLMPSLEPEALRVPWLVRFPAPVSPGAGASAPRGIVDAPVSLVDLTPTLLDALGLAERLDLDGRSVVPGARQPDRAVVVATRRGVRGATWIDGGGALELDLDLGTARTWVREPAGSGGASRWSRGASRAADPQHVVELVHWMEARGVATPVEARFLLDSSGGL